MENLRWLTTVLFSVTSAISVPPICLQCIKLRPPRRNCWARLVLPERQVAWCFVKTKSWGRKDQPERTPLATCLVKAGWLQKGCNRISAWWILLVEFCFLQEKTVVCWKLWEFSQMSVTSLFKKKKNARCKKQNLRNQCNSHFSTFETSINSIRKIWGGVLYTQTHTAKILTWY